MRIEKTILLAAVLLLSCSKPEKNTMLTLTDIGLVKDGGSRQFTFTNEAGELHSFYLQIEPLRPDMRHIDRKFVGFYCGNIRHGGEPASHTQIQDVCAALQRWHDGHDTPKYRVLKAEWDSLAHRLGRLETESDEEIQRIMNRLKEIESSDGWANHVIESKWTRETILELSSSS